MCDQRETVFLLHQEGQPAREIARLLGLSRNAVRAIIQQGGEAPPPRPRADQQPLDEELLRRLYQECHGHIARVHEKLVEEEGVAVAYSTLTQRLRQLGLSDPPKARCQQAPDEPGAESRTDALLSPARQSQEWTKRTSCRHLTTKDAVECSHDAPSRQKCRCAPKA